MVNQTVAVYPVPVVLRGLRRTDQVMAGMSERAVVYKAKESDIFSGREIYHKGRIEYLPTGYVAAIVYEFRGRKATKKCVEQARETVC